MGGNHRSLIRAIAAMVGTIIGAGIFGLPAVFLQLGTLRGSLLFLLVAIVVCVTHLLYASIHLHTKKSERLSGYAHQYLGAFGGNIASVTYPFHIFGSNLIHLLLGGQFLAVLFSHFGWGMGVLHWQALFWAIVAVCILYGVRFVIRLEAIGTWLLLAGMFVSMVVLAFVVPSPPLEPAFSPVLPSLFGIFLFSLFGLPVVGEVVDIVGKKTRAAYVSVAVGTLLAAFVSWLFAMSLVRVATDIPMDAFALQAFFPRNGWWIIPLVGFLAILTSYLTTAQDLMKSFQVDWGFRRDRAWVLALFPPFILLFIAQTTFLSLMDLIGSVFSATNALLVCVIFLALNRRKRSLSYGRWLVPIVPILLFGYAIGQKILSLFP